VQESSLLTLFLVLLCVRLCAISNSLLLDRGLLSIPPCHLRPVGTANETVAVTDVASQAPNMMSSVGNLKAASQASVESTARERCCIQPIAMNSVVFYLLGMDGHPAGPSLLATC
jgi:hypothetical protein